MHRILYPAKTKYTHFSSKQGRLLEFSHVLNYKGNFNKYQNNKKYFIPLISDYSVIKILIRN